MAKKWTTAQQKAIDCRDRTLLVSAAAGSGKTATLTQRIICSLLDEEKPVDISRLLVVTFTRAAAGELRARIAKSLSDALAGNPKNARIAKQLMLLGSAKISTIDSFNFDLVRANFEKTAFSPNIRIADKAECMPLRLKCMKKAVDDAYRNDADFKDVSAVFSNLRGETSLIDKLLNVFFVIEHRPEGLLALLRSADETEKCGKNVFSSSFGKEFEAQMTEFINDSLSFFKKAFAEIEFETNGIYDKSKRYFTERITRFEQLQEALISKNFSSLSALLGQKFGESKPQANKAFNAAFRSYLACCPTMKDYWDNTAKLYGNFTENEVALSCARSSKMQRALYRVLFAFEKDYAAAKKEKEIAEFSDISHAAYRLLIDEFGNPTPLAVSMRQDYDAVYIDEFQDSDSLQDAVFSAISTPENRFMVGDIKQSIYRFRGAEPDIFSRYRKEFEDISVSKNSNASIIMSDCFRCDPAVIDFTNAISGFLFNATKESIGYTKQDDLNCKKDLPQGYVGEKCKLVYTEKEGELPFVVKEIKKLLNETKADGERILPGDIAVFSRSETPLGAIGAALTEAGIPVLDTTKKNFFDNPEILCIFSLLSVIDNPFSDIQLAATLRSPLFGFNLEELVTVRGFADRSHALYDALKNTAQSQENKELGQKCTDFLKKLEGYRVAANKLPVDKLLRLLYRDLAVFAYRDTEGANSAKKRLNLQKFYGMARRFESNGFRGLYQFLRFLQSKMSTPENESEISAENAVTLSTIHKSKGLEYAVCFLVNADSRFNDDDYSDRFLFDKNIGGGFKIPNADVFSAAKNFSYNLLSAAIKRASREEEMRILYVAMTRARERLYITGEGEMTTPDPAIAETVAKPAVLSCNNYLDWIEYSLSTVKPDNFCEISAPVAETATETPIGELIATGAKYEIAKREEEKEEKIKEELKKRFDFVYPYSHLMKIPAKLSVSRLTAGVLDVNGEDGAELHEEEAEHLLHGFEKAPDFGKEKVTDAAARGTATHEFLQFCNFERCEKEGVEKELDLLISGRFLPESARTAVRINELQKFFESRFYSLLKQAKDMHRESRFNIFLKAADFTENKELKSALGKEKLLVQGVIDLFFTDEKGNLVLCDYKTDRLPPETFQNKEAAAAFLFARHGEQLAYYKEALKQLLGKEPDRILIYSLPFGDALEGEIPPIAAENFEKSK